MLTSVLDKAGRPKKVIGRDWKPQSTIDDISSNYDLIGFNYTNEIALSDTRRFHPGKAELVELQKFARSSTKPTIAQLDGDEDLNDSCCFLSDE